MTTATSIWLKRGLLCLTGFIQVALVAIDTWFISHNALFAAVGISFCISFIWTWNVKRVVFGTNFDRVVYSFGAAMGTMVGLIIARSLVS